MSLQSTFESLPLDELFLLLASTKQTGVVHFVGDQPVDVWLEDGTVVFVDRSDDSSLEDALVYGGAVPRQVWEIFSVQGPADLTAVTRQPGVRPDLVAEVVRERIVDGIFPLLLVPDASYLFEAGAEAPHGGLVHLDVDTVLADARQRLDDWTVIARSVRSLEAVVTPSMRLPDGWTQVVLSSAEWPLLSMADGHKSLGDLVRQSGFSAFAICSAAHRLAEKGLLTIVEA